MKNLLFIFLFFSNILFGATLAQIGKYKITDNDVINALTSSGINNYSHELFVKKLNDLIEEKKLLLYAEENNIIVTDKEVDSFFIQEFGRHKKFLTNGVFDNKKYLKLKSNPKVKLILNSIKKDLLIQKSKSIICNQFQYSDKKLLEEYIKKNARLNLNYAILPADLIDVPTECDPMEVYEYYKTISDKYYTEEKVKADFCVVKDSTFKDKISISDSEVLNFFEKQYSTIAPFIEIKDSLRQILTQQKIHSEAKSFTDSLLINWSLNDSLNYPILHSDYLTRGNKFYNIPNSKDIVTNLFTMDYQPRIKELKDGFILYRLSDKIDKKHLSLDDNPVFFWEKYVEFKINELSKNKYKDLYLKNLDKFITQAVSVNYIIINKPNPENIIIDKKSIKDYYYNHFSNNPDSTFSQEYSKIRNLLVKNKVDSLANKIKSELFLNFYDAKKRNLIIKKYNLKTQKKLIFTGKISNNNYYDELVANSIKKYPNRKEYYVQDENTMILYSIESVFEDYLPSYDEIKQDIFKYVDLPEDDFDAYEFYNNHKKDFFIPDSLQIGGAFIPILDDSVTVSPNDISGYYHSHINKFKVKDSYLFDYICLEKSKIAFMSQLYQQLQKVPFDLVKEVFSKPGDFNNFNSYEFDKLPKNILNSLKNINTGEITKPLVYKDKCYIFKLKKFIPSYDLTMVEAEKKIEKLLRYKKAKETAYNYAKTIFDSTNYYSQCKIYADSTWLFKTKFQSINDDFKPLGSIDSFITSFKRLYNYEKLNRIISYQNGFAIIYKLKYKKGRYQTFDESYDKIKELYQLRNKDIFSYNFVKSIEEKIAANVNPDSLLYFFGGYHSLKNLTIDSDISNLPFGKFIINDAISRQSGEFSNPIKINNKDYFFYRVNSIRKVKTKDFLKNKNIFRKKLIEEKYKNWLKKYPN